MQSNASVTGCMMSEANSTGIIKMSYNTVGANKPLDNVSHVYITKHNYDDCNGGGIFCTKAQFPFSVQMWIYN